MVQIHEWKIQDWKPISSPRNGTGASAFQGINEQWPLNNPELRKIFPGV